MDWTIRRIEGDEARQLRAIRLRALADSPSAFGSTLASEEAQTDDHWERRASLSSTGDDSAVFVADAGGDWVGLAGGFREADRPEHIQLVSMWVEPQSRGTGAGQALVQAVLDWSVATGAAAVELWVTRGNEAAERLYRRMGFQPTREFQPLPSDPCKDEERMRLELPRVG